MVYDISALLSHINRIRREIGHEEVNIDIKDLIYNAGTNEMWIITNDRPDKSAIIGKGGWVVGRLREELGINSIHVESYSDYLIKEYRMELSLNKLKNFVKTEDLDDDSRLALYNLIDILTIKLDNLYSFDFKSYFDDLENGTYSYFEAKKPVAVVALSGGTDSSFSLILAKKLGFNPVAVTVDPGTIVLPKQFKYNIEKLTKSLDVRHEYVPVDYSEIIEDSFSGRFHPCGRCSKKIEETIFKYAIDNDIPMVIFGDMLATGSQCITEQFYVENEVNDNGDSNGDAAQNENLKSVDSKDEVAHKLFRLNLPASLAVSKLENKSLTKNYDLNKFKGFGCPLLYEVHKKFPHMKKYSIQRILRETRSSALEPGEALDLIWSFYNTD
ncbi:MAG: ATPase [Methanobrevibacter sp.]|nr:ATPase [Methanobrevibacter sp.]